MSFTPDCTESAMRRCTTDIIDLIEENGLKTAKEVAHHFNLYQDMHCKAKGNIAFFVYTLYEEEYTAKLFGGIHFHRKYPEVGYYSVIQL